MKMTIESETMIRNGTCIGEILVLLEIVNNVHHDVVISNLIKKGYITSATGQKFVTQKTYALTEKATALLETVNLESLDSDNRQTRDIEALAQKLMDIYPKGKKEGTAYYWKGNKKEIIDKLKKFFVYFGDTYTDSQIISATKEYVNSFNGNYRYMRLLKYFIWKNDRKTDTNSPENSSIEQISELASYIENAGQESNNSAYWAGELI